LEVELDDIKDLAVPGLCAQLALRVFVLDRNELIGIDTSSVVPHGVILRVGLEELRRLLQQFWCEVAITDLEQPSTIMTLNGVKI
jgi:hypothetical protein